MDISPAGKIILYTDIIIFGILCILLFFWQLNVLRGRSMKNPDGSADDWHEQKIFYGIALSDLTLAVPLTLLGIILIFLNNEYGYYITAMTAFWFVWINAACTITSLKFHKPKITVMWFIVFPFGAIIGLIYLVWSLVYFNRIFIN